MPMFHNSLGDALLALGDHEQAIHELRAALQLDGGFRAARVRLVRCFERAGRFAEALAERRMLDDSERLQRFTRALAEDGAEGYRRERAVELRTVIRDVTDRVNAGSPASAADLFNPPELRLALAHAELGEWDEALRWEEHAAAIQPGRRQWFLGRPELRPLSARRIDAGQAR